MKKIKFTKTGQVFSTRIAGKEYSKKVTKEEYIEIGKQVELYNKTNSERSMKALLKLLAPKTIEANKKEEQQKVAKKAIEKKIKKEEAKPDTQAKSKAKELLNVVKSISSKQIKEEMANLIVTREGMVFKGFEKVPMPDLLVSRIKEFVENKVSIQPLLNFWLLCLANPNHIARTKLFEYLDKHKMMITPSGYFVTYRMVKTTDDPNKFTHAHDGIPRLYYRVGEVATLNRATECDEDGANDCSKGIHFGSPQFIGIRVEEKEGLGEGYNKGEKVVTKTINNEGHGTGYSSPTTKTTTEKFDHSFGNQATIWLVNPMHVVSVPNSDTRKLRACEGYFVKLTTPEEVVDMVEKDYLIFDINYQQLELHELKKMIDSNKLKGYISSDSYAKGALTKLRKLLGNLDLNTGANKQDSISKDLDLEQIKTIIKARLSILNK